MNRWYFLLPMGLFFFITALTGLTNVWIEDSRKIVLFSALVVGVICFVILFNNNRE